MPKLQKIRKILQIRNQFYVANVVSVGNVIFPNLPEDKRQDVQSRLKGLSGIK